MWCTVSCATLLRQHLPSRPGSHQQLVSGSPASQASTLRHLSTTSLAKVGRWRKLMIELIVPGLLRSEEHTSELQSLMRISYAVFCLKKKTQRIPRARITRDNIYFKHLPQLHKIDHHM